MSLYNRVAELTVIQRSNGLIRQIKDLRFSFSIQKTSDFIPNNSEISIYNLNSDSRDFMESTTLDIILKAGYTGITGNEDLSRVIFAGNVTRVESEKSGPDIITKLECEDAGLEMRDTKFNKTYDIQGGTPIKLIINELIEALNVSVSQENIKGITDEKFVNPVVLSGTVKDNLNNMTKKLDLEWSIQDGSIHIRPRGTFNTVDIFVLNAETGLLGIPIKREDGIEFVSLINPLLTPTKTVQITSKVAGSGVNGLFVVQTAIYNGDTREGDWSVRCEALEPESAD